MTLLLFAAAVAVAAALWFWAAREIARRARDIAG